jgi:hypothetical protein
MGSSGIDKNVIDCNRRDCESEGMKGGLYIMWIYLLEVVLIKTREKSVGIF